MWKAYFNGIIRPIDGGHYSEAYPAMLAISSKGLFAPSQRTLYNRAPWSQRTSFSGCVAQEWQGMEHRDKKGTRNLSQRLFSQVPAKKWFLASKEALTLPEERARRLPALVLQFSSRWPSLLALAGRGSCLPVPSLVTATLEMAGKAQE